ncbi:5-formyltetrahydrofolate cyclo-ligase [Candidatus Aerophobetes bacterium]|nr:5-formyltetrahydrofolate cyclo-ligase [Candidatus Aerophobetes bacterium]
MRKKVTRRSALHTRRSLSSEQIEEKSEKIRENLFKIPVFKRSNMILFYISLPEEVQTYRMIADSLKVGKRVAVPVVDLVKKEIIPFEIKNPQVKLESGPFDVPEPVNDERYPLSLKEIELVIVPGVAFDAQGGRVGFGGGFYDRFLEKLSSRVIPVALAFECQIVDKVPCDEHDMAVDYIITEKKIVRCRNCKQR